MKYRILGYIFLVVVATAIVSGIYYWQLTNTQIITNSFPLPTHNATASWKTYTNTQYGFEFKYPSTLYAKDDSYSFALETSPIKVAFGGVIPEGVEGKDYISTGYRIFVSKQGKVKNISLVSNSAQDYKVTKLNQPQINAYKVQGDVPGGPNVYIQDPQDPNSFIEMGYDAACKDNNIPCVENEYSLAENMLNQILSTFKFTK